MSLSLQLATFLMRWGSRNSRFGHQECYTQEFVKPAPGEVSVATRREFDDGAGFFLPFEGKLSARDLEGKDVLDLGSGHGGRTAYYLLHGNPRSILGIEISYERVSVAQTSVRRLCDDGRISFLVGVGEAIPARDASFDAIISYDVFEHVQDLPRVLRECYRVLRPGGRLYTVFPPYYGPRAHHLDFVTTLPFLHYVFPPRVLVDAANQILKEQPGIRDEPLPAPARSYQGREVLPRLNGTTEKEFRRIVAGLPFEVEQMKLLPFAWGPGGPFKRVVRASCRALLRLPWPWTRDMFIGTICCILKKGEKA
ncbi:MAG TPA: class I SAM-dependent methyltransferase [Blastocatellia bacterium]|nr:class I SAM-dependent methyltransferase [Blastocatellia bacterium]